MRAELIAVIKDPDIDAMTWLADKLMDPGLQRLHSTDRRYSGCKCSIGKGIWAQTLRL